MKPIKVSDDVELLQRLKQYERAGRTVRALKLTSVTDGGIEVLAQSPAVTGLETLLVQSSQVTDTALLALIHSTCLTSLEKFSFNTDRLTDAGVIGLAGSSFLDQLKSVNLSGGNFKDAAVKALALSPHASKLEGLSLRHTELTDRGLKSIAKSPNLRCLRSLNVSETRVTDTGLETLVESTGLPSLRFLNLRKTFVTDGGISRLARGKNFPNLKQVNLEATQVTDTGIRELVQSAYLSQLLKVILTKTSVNLPERIKQTGDAVAIRQFLREAQLGGPLFEVKVPVLGLGSLGKSLLVRRLTGKKKGAFWHDNLATSTFDVTTTTLSVDREGRAHRCTLRLFYFGGQPELYGVHRLFLADKRNVYTIVVSARLSMAENRLDYWLRMVKHRGGDAPVVVVVTHCDDQRGAKRGRKVSKERALSPLSAEQLSREYQLFVQVVDEYSNVTGANLQAVQTALANAVAHLDAVFKVRFPRGLFVLRDRLRTASGQKHATEFRRYWTFDDEFQAACKGAGQTDPAQQRLWLALLRDLGYVHFVGDRPTIKREAEHSLANYLFHLEWVKMPMYNVVRLQEARHTGGIVSGRQVEAALRLDDMSDEDVRRLLALMLEYELLFRVRGGNPIAADYLIPDQIDFRPQKVRLDWVDLPTQKYRWTFRFLPDYLLTQLIGRWFVYFRDDVILSRPDCKGRVRIKADFGAHALDLEFDHAIVRPLKLKLEWELENLLDPEGMLRARPWVEHDLSEPQEPIDELQVAKIAEVLASSSDRGIVNPVRTVVRALFESTIVTKLTNAEKCVWRVCWLWAYAKADLVHNDVEDCIPNPWIAEVKEVLDWLDGAGKEIKESFPKHALKTLSNRGSFRTNYKTAFKKLGRKPKSRDTRDE